MRCFHFYSITIISLIIAIGCAGNFPVNSLLECSDYLKQSKYLSLNYTDLIDNFGSCSDGRNFKSTRNKIQNSLEVISKNQCADFWESISKDIERTDYSDRNFYLVRSGAGGVINEVDRDGFCALNPRRQIEFENPPYFCPEFHKDLNGNISPTNVKIPSKIDLSKPPWWFQPKIFLSNSEKHFFHLKPVEARSQTFPAPFLFDSESQRPPVWVYRLDDAVGFQNALKDHLVKLDEEKNVRRKIISDKIEQGKKKSIADYSIEEAINDVMALNKACHIEPLLELNPTVPTLKNLEAWIHRINTPNHNVSEPEIDALKDYWSQQKVEFQNTPMIKNVIHSFTKLLENEKARIVQDQASLSKHSLTK